MPRTVLLILALLAACGSTGQTQADKDRQKARSERDQIAYEAAIQEGRVLFGMTKKEVLASWGEPMRKKRVVFRGKRRENWVYRYYDLFFDSAGYVTGMSSVAR